jgi:hypothetical protein
MFVETQRVAETYYNQEFQDRHSAGSLASAEVVLPILFEFYRPESVIDIGCGLGSWLKIARDLGVQSLLGLDGDQIDRAKLLIDLDDFRAVELSERIAVDRRFDLAISVEVAEHLPYSRSESFVADLTALSDVVLFSAAAPYQGGVNHVNEQWLEFWGILFRRFGYVACDVLRRRVWGNPAVEFWYRQNLMIFCKAETALAIFPAETVASGRALSFTHPLSLLTNAARYRPLLLAARELECRDYTALAQAYLSGDVTLPPMKILEAVAEDQTRLFPEARIRVRDAAADVAAYHHEVDRLGTEIERLLRALEDGRRDIDGLHRELEIRDTEIGRLNRESEREIARLNRESEREIARLNACMARAQERARRMGIALSARNREVLSNRRTAIWRLATRLGSLRASVSAEARNRRDARLVMMSGLFDQSYYVSQQPRLETLGLDPVRHYVEYGAAEGRDPNPLFDTSFYRESNPDVTRSRMNPLAHYHAYGGAEGRDPHPSFKTSAYLRQNPEVLQAGMTPLLHYLVFGNAV